MGGTFDHLHEGHKFLIKTALELSKKIVIGLTDENLIKNKKYYVKIEDFNTRKKKLHDYIASITDQNRVEIVPLEDHFGPPVKDPEYEAIIVSEETYKGAQKINEIRVNKGFTPLIIIVIPMIKDANNRIISSTSIRESLQ